MPADQEPPTSNVHHSYIDNAVIKSDADRYQRINGGTVTPAAPRPPSPADGSLSRQSAAGSISAALPGARGRTRLVAEGRGMVNDMTTTDTTTELEKSEAMLANLDAALLRIESKRS